MTDYEAIVALNAEARRRGISYGKLVASTTQPERYEIIRKAERAKREGLRSRKGKGNGCPGV